MFYSLMLPIATKCPELKNALNNKMLLHTYVPVESKTYGYVVIKNAISS